MSRVPIKIPQLGEGLQEARLLRFLKKPGERIERDEPLFEMETDKAVTEVESPYSGVVCEWTAEEDSVHDIGAEIGFMDVEESRNVEDSPAYDEPQHAAVESEANSDVAVAPMVKALANVTAKGIPIPRRTRRYIRENKLEAVAEHIPARGKRLTEEDIDRYLEVVTKSGNVSGNGAADYPAEYRDSPLPSAQHTLNYRMVRGTQVVVPAVLETDLEWSNIRNCRDATRDQGGPTGFAMFLYCVTRAMVEHPMLRSSLVGEGKTIRTYNNVNLGVAVALPGDELKTALVPAADTLTQHEFFEQLSVSVASAREGKDQATASTTVSVSNIGTANMRAGIPVVVAPAVATLAIGKVQTYAVPADNGIAFVPRAALTMTFDHRLLNGVGAANFLNEIAELVASFQLDD